jgi:hypothetical protein
MLVVSVPPLTLREGSRLEPGSAESAGAAGTDPGGAADVTDATRGTEAGKPGVVGGGGPVSTSAS